MAEIPSSSLASQPSAFGKSVYGWIWLALFIASVLYGVSYQQYHFFDIENDALSDSISYVRMANGHFDVADAHRNRPLIPFLASQADRVTGHKSDRPDRPSEALRLGFYAVNFTFMFFAAFFLFLILAKLGFATPWCYIGVTMFLTSRVAVYSTGAPLVDSAFFFAVVVVVYLMLEEQFLLLACLAPVLALTKETVLPFLFLPILFRFRWWTVVSFLLSVLAFYLMISYTGSLVLHPKAAASHEFYQTVLRCVRETGAHAIQIGTAKGIRDVFHSFSFFLPLAVVGVWINWRSNLVTIPLFIKLILPLCIIFALLSGNIGRMLFAAFPVVIPYALLTFQWVSSQPWKGRNLGSG